jgi:hypothetical protein
MPSAIRFIHLRDHWVVGRAENGPRVAGGKQQIIHAKSSAHSRHPAACRRPLPVPQTAAGTPLENPPGNSRQATARPHRTTARHHRITDPRAKTTVRRRQTGTGATDHDPVPPTRDPVPPNHGPVAPGRGPLPPGRGSFPPDLGYFPPDRGSWPQFRGLISSPSGLYAEMAVLAQPNRRPCSKTEKLRPAPSNASPAA